MSDEELIDIVKHFTAGKTGGEIKRKCIIISKPLSRYLNELGVKNKLVEYSVRTPSSWWSHWALELEDGRILDATAGQFDLDLPTIYLGELPSSFTLQTAL